MASRSQTDQAQQLTDIGELLHELSNKIDRLKTLYEQYFMGIEKMEPQVARKEVTRAMLLLQQQYIRNTALRFKFNTMLQKWNIYITYWNRILREIENGTYVRHLAKAKRKAAQQGRELPSEMAAATKKLRPAPGAHDLEDDSSGATFLDTETGAKYKTVPRAEEDDELEQVWDRLIAGGGRPTPTPPPATLAPRLPSAPMSARDKVLADLAAAKNKAVADLEARKPGTSAPPPLPPSARPLPPPAPAAAPPRPLPPGMAPMTPMAASRERSVPINVDSDRSGPLPKVNLPPPAPAARNTTPPPARAAVAPAAVLPRIPGMNEPELRALHQRYVDAQKQSGSQAGVKYETLVNSLAKQVPTVLNQPGVKGVRFDVSVQNGRPVLKAIPQK